MTTTLEQIPPARPRHKNLKFGLLALILTGLVWLGVVIWWQETHRLVVAQDVLIYLGAVPLLLICLVALAIATPRWIEQAFKARQMRNSAAALNTPSTETPRAEHVTSRLPLLGAVITTPIGNSLTDVLSALRERKSRPQLDASLTNEDGFPITTGRVADLDTTEIDQSLQSIVAGLPPDIRASYAGGDAFIRALALADSALTALEAQWPFPPRTLSQRNEASPSQGLPELFAKFIIPSHFSRAQQLTAERWFEQRMARLPNDQTPWSGEILVQDEGPNALVALDRFSQFAQREQRPVALLLCGCDSLLDDDHISALQMAGKLYSQSNPDGVVPAEASFALLAGSHQTIVANSLTAPVELAQTAFCTRDSSADTRKKNSHTVLGSTTEQVLQAMAITAGDVAGVICDADHRPSRISESLGTVLELLPHLDAIEDQHATNAAIGHAGAASSGLLLALAAELAREQPIAALSVAHSFERAVALLAPAGWNPQAEPNRPRPSA